MSNEQGNSDVPGTGRPKRPRAEDSGSSICPTCDEEVSTSHDGVQCQWCHVWEHCKCAKLSVGEYNMLSLNSPRIMFFCCECNLKVNQALEFFDNMFNRQNVFDQRLQSIENKLDKLTLGVVGPEDDNDEEMSCHDTAETAPAGTVPVLDLEPSLLGVSLLLLPQ